MDAAVGSGFLRLGASGAATAAGGVLGARRGPRRAAAGRRRRATTSASWPSAPWPKGRAAFYRKALATPGLFDAGERRRLTQARDAKREHYQRLNAALGADAVGSGDFEVDLPKTRVRHPRPRPRAGRRASRSCSSASTSTAPASRPTRARACCSAACSTVDGQLLAWLRAMAGKAVGRRPADPADHRAGRRRPRQAHHRSRLARRTLTMRRTTLATVLAVVAGPRRCRAGGRAGAHRLRRRLAEQRLPGDRQGARRTTSAAPTRCSCRSSAARPPTCSRRPARRRRRRCSARACARARSRSRQRARAARCRTPTRATCARSTRCAPAGASSSIGTAGVPIGDYTRQLLRRMRLSSILSSNTVSQRDQRRPASPRKVALGLGRRRLRLLHRRAGGDGPHER